MRDINALQTNIMIFVKDWGRKINAPVPQKEIIRFMTINGVKSYTALNAINSLLTKGYLRRAYSPKANVSLYVMIRNIRDDYQYDFTRFQKK